MKAKPELRIAPSAPFQVGAALDALGLEVGDYHRPDDLLWIVQHDKAWGIKLEGWGPECVPGKGCRAARREAELLAREWRSKFDQAGWLKVIEDDRVWAITWAMVGPLAVSEADPGDTITLPD